MNDRSRCNSPASSLALLVLAGIGALSLSSAPLAAQQVKVAQRGQTSTHIVEEGDTLYDLSGRYTGDVFNWPEIWSYNPQITNPHWIYPGDVVYLRPPEQIALDGGPRRGVSQKSYQPSELYMSLGGFIQRDELPYVGRIVASPKQANLLSEHDTVWVGFGDQAYTPEELDEIRRQDVTEMRQLEGEVQVGDVFAIVRSLGQVTAWDDEDVVLGEKFMVLGSLRVQEINKNYLETAEITQSWYEIERGDLLVPYEEQLKQVQIIQSNQNLAASIVDTIEPRTALGEFHYVVVDKGSNDEVRQGNRFYIFQKREGLQDFTKEAGSQIPWQRIGQVLLIDVREQYSTGVIIDSSREVFKGDRLEMYQGY